MQKEILSALTKRGWGISFQGGLLEYETPYALVPLWEGAGGQAVPWVTIPELCCIAVAQGEAGELVESGEVHMLNSFTIRHTDLVHVSIPQGVLAVDDATFIAMLGTLPLLLS